MNTGLLILIIITAVILTAVYLFHMAEYTIYKYIWGGNKRIFPSEKRVEIV